MNTLDQVDWLQYRTGDHAAFARIYRRHKDQLLTYCLYSGLSRETGEDTLQDAFASLARQIEPIHSIRNWLFICVRNAALNRLTRQGRSTDLTAQYIAETPLNPELEQLLQRVLGRLEREERELILLRELHGLSIEDLAQIWQVTEEAIRVRLYRVRKRMHELGKVLI